MDNTHIAQVLSEVASLLDIKGENAFRVRAYRSAADTIAHWPDPVAQRTHAQLLEIPGVGKDLATKVVELATTSRCQVHEELLGELGAGVLELLRLQGLGPKTVALLHSTLGVGSLDQLAEAAKDGRLAALKGMGAKKAAQILTAIQERNTYQNRHLLPDAAAVAADMVAHLAAAGGVAEFVPVGSLRRGVETCGDVDVLAIGADAAVLDAVITHPRVERVLAHGDTKTSVRIQGGVQVDVRLVPAESRGAALQYFTGSKAHNIAVRDRALERGLRLNEYGLVRLEDGTVVAGATEEGIYDALGLEWIPPELRENRGEVQAAEAGSLPRLLEVADLRGDLHMHTTVTDGRDDLATMAEAARRLGYEYIAITDHSQALAMANGLDERRALAHARTVRTLNGRYEGLTLLAGIECDILSDGRLDLTDDCLAELDFVVASVHSNFQQEEAQMTDRILRALDCPWVDVLGHPTGRKLLKRAPAHVDMLQVVTAAARLGVALEINSQVRRLDLNDAHATLAREHGVRLVISSDAHSTSELGNVRWGAQMARRAWAGPADVLNTLPLVELVPLLRRHRRSSGS